MQVRPDSALQLLQSLDVQIIPHGALQARYALLYTQALDKNYLPLSGDTLIDIAINYYSQKKEYHKLSWAYFYKGNAFAQVDSLESALTLYKRVQEYLQFYADDELLTLVTNEMGVLFQEQRHFKEALELFKASLVASRKSGNLKHENYVLGRIGNVFYRSAEIDSAEVYFYKAKEFALFRKDSAYYYRLNINISTLLRAKEQYGQAIALLTDMVSQMKGQAIAPIEYYPLLSMLYLDVRQIDSARHYMNMVLQDSCAGIKQRAGALAGLKKIEEQAGNFQASIDYAVQYEVLSDSIRHEYYLHDLRIAEEKYRQEKLKEVNMEQRTRHIGRVVGISSVSLVGVVVIIACWKKRIAQKNRSLRELRRSYCEHQWNTTLFFKEFDIYLDDWTENVFHSRVIKAAQIAYPGMTNWLKKRFPLLNIADTVFSCLLYANLGPKDLCGLYKLRDPAPLYTRRSRLYQKLGVKVDRKKPISFRDILMDLYVYDTV